MSIEITLITWFKETVRTVRKDNVSAKEYRALCSIHGKDNVTIISKGLN